MRYNVAVLRLQETHMQGYDVLSIKLNYRRTIYCIIAEIKQNQLMEWVSFGVGNSFKKGNLVQKTIFYSL